METVRNGRVSSAIRIHHDARAPSTVFGPGDGIAGLDRSILRPGASPDRDTEPVTRGGRVAGNRDSRGRPVRQHRRRRRRSVPKRSPDCVGEIGTFGESPRRSCFGEALVGYYRSSSIGPRIPNFDYVPIAFRLGYRPWEDRGYIASRISILAAATVDPITASFGNYMTGASLMVRYDVCPDRTVCPYFQGGTGFVLTDAWRDRNQGAIGEEFEFLQQLQVGVRWKLSECLAIEAECGLQHVSNGGLARHNLGANDLGGSIGLRWTFGGR